MRLLCALVIVACTASAWPNPVQSRESDRDAPVIAAFTDSARAYVRLKGATRSEARHGDIFTPQVTDYFRDVIGSAFRGSEARNMRRTIRETEALTLPTLRVNDVYPNELPTTTMPPTLLRRLPRLPPELAYRIVGRALMLQDVRTDVIVDFVLDAIPGTR